MKAAVYRGERDVAVEDVPDVRIECPLDTVVSGVLAPGGETAA